MSRHYESDRAREFAFNGFARRLKIMARCATRVFEILPPDLQGLPARSHLDDAEIQIQAFVFNTSGSLDNLAWIWVSERRLDIPRSRVGLAPNNKDVRQSLSPEFRDFLGRFDQWFDFIEDYRHSLAHRIPLYIPPYVVRTCDEEGYSSLGARMLAALTRGDFDEYDRLEGEQERLAVFQPHIMHSFGEQARPVWFHAKLIADFLTVDEIAWKMLAELSSGQTRACA